MQNDCIDASNEKCMRFVFVRCRMDRDLADLQEKTGVVNRKRKMDQEAAGEKLMNTEWQVLELQMKNYQIEVVQWLVLDLRNPARRWRAS